MTQLRSTTFLLRPLTPADAPAMAAAVRESGASVGKWMSWAHADYSEAEALDWVAFCEASRADDSAHEFGIFRSDGLGASLGLGPSFVGVAGLNQFNRVNGFCNLGYWVRASAQRQGAALAAIGLLADYAFDRLAQTRVEIVVAAGNAPSLAAARKAGAVYECLARNRLRLHGKAVDAHLLSLLPHASSQGN